MYKNKSVYLEILFVCVDAVRSSHIIQRERSAYMILSFIHFVVYRFPAYVVLLCHLLKNASAL